MLNHEGLGKLDRFVYRKDYKGSCQRVNYGLSKSFLLTMSPDSIQSQIHSLNRLILWFWAQDTNFANTFNVIVLSRGLTRTFCVCFPFREASQIDFVHEKRHIDVLLETPPPPLRNVTALFGFCRRPSGIIYLAVFKIEYCV